MRSAATESTPVEAATLAWVRRPVSPWVLGGLLALVTIALYWPATRCEFVNYDDPDFVTGNLHVQRGLNWEGVKWAFGNTAQAVYWAPMMWLSHMVVYQFCGLNAWAHHLVNVLLHAANTALVFLVFRQMTGATWRSLILAAFFGWHPLRVESVAWVTERKDVLSVFFFMLTLWTYVRYAMTNHNGRHSAGGGGLGGDLIQHPVADLRQPFSILHSPASLYCALALGFFALGLMSKPMLVTLPCVLLLLDYWPLKRMKSVECRVGNAKPGTSLRFIILEKLPFFALAAAASIVTFAVQHHGGALAGDESLPLGARAANALISYCRYLGKLLWPTNLAVFYPHPGSWPALELVLAGALMLGISVLLFLTRRPYPFLLMGWLWYCGTLVPVIGLVQSGEQAMADRFTYLPSVGLLVLVIWGAGELAKFWRQGFVALSTAAAVALLLCMAATRHQLAFWRDSETLFRHAIEVTRDNYVAHNNLGSALDEKGASAEAVLQFQETLRLKPDNAMAHYDLGVTLVRMGEISQGISEYRQTLRLKPDHAPAHYSLGNALIKNGQIVEAIKELQEAVRLDPDLVEAHNNLGFALARERRFDEAISQFEEALRLKPDHANARKNLDALLAARARSGRPDGPRR
jgi:protein O-mannosyl-transferase